MNVLPRLTAAIIVSCCVLTYSCAADDRADVSAATTVGYIERLDPAMDEIIDTNAVIEMLASGFGWAEGPVWLAGQHKLLFTDVKKHKIYEWTQENNLKVYLDLTDADADRPGPSALLLNGAGELVMLRYGHGQVVKMKSPVSQPSTKFEIVADKYNGIAFNNTNDASYHVNGDMIMSDPPPPTETPSGERRNGPGLYRIDTRGQVQLITDSMSSPNGIAFSPDYRKIYVANADAKNAYWIVADVDEGGRISNGRTFFDATGYAPATMGHPDGLRVNKKGIIFATGPGGIFIFSPEGKHLGTIKNNQFNTNCVFDHSEDTLFITAGSYLMRVVMKREKN